jgi:hypothetical protein
MRQSFDGRCVLKFQLATQEKTRDANTPRPRDTGRRGGRPSKTSEALALQNARLAAQGSRHALKSSTREGAAKNAQRAPGGPFLKFLSYCFGSGSGAKFAWTNIHLLSFFTNTRVDFARSGVVFPSLSMVRPT